MDDIPRVEILQTVRDTLQLRDVYSQDRYASQTLAVPTRNIRCAGEMLVGCWR